VKGWAEVRLGFDGERWIKTAMAARLDGTPSNGCSPWTSRRKYERPGHGEVEPIPFDDRPMGRLSLNFLCETGGWNGESGLHAPFLCKRVPEVAASVELAEATVFQGVHQHRIDCGELPGTPTLESAGPREAERRLSELEAELATIKRASELFAKTQNVTALGDWTCKSLQPTFQALSYPH